MIVELNNKQIFQKITKYFSFTKIGFLYIFHTFFLIFKVPNNKQKLNKKQLEIYQNKLHIQKFLSGLG